MSSFDSQYKQQQQQQTTCSSQQRLMVNAILQLFRDQELGRIVLSLVMPLNLQICVIFTNFSDSPPQKLMMMNIALLSLCIGIAALWNGHFLRNKFPKIADAVEQLGTVCVIVAFYGVVGSYLPPRLLWVNWLCLAFTLLSFIFSHLPVRDVEAPHENSEAHVS